MKKIPFLLIPLALTALVDCGGGNNDNPSDKSQGDYSGKVVVNFWHTFGDKVEKALEGKIAQFEKLVKENAKKFFIVRTAC